MSSPVSSCAKALGWVVLADVLAVSVQTGWFNQALAPLPPAQAMTTKIIVGLGCAVCFAIAALDLWSMPTAVRPTKPQGLAPQSQGLVPGQR